MHKCWLKPGGSLAKSNAGLKMEVKQLIKKLEEKPETNSEAEGEMVQKLTQELKNAKDLLKLRNMEIKILKQSDNQYE